MKMHGCVMGFEHFGHHGGHGRKHHGHSHNHGHRGFGPHMFGPFAFGHHGHHGPRRFGTHGHARGCFGHSPRGPFPFEFRGFGCGPFEFGKHGHHGFGKHGPFGKHGHGPFGKHGHHGSGPCGRDEEVQDFDRFVDRNGFEWRLYISEDDAAAERNCSAHDATCDEENSRNEARESSDSECERSRRCWGKQGGRKFGKQGRKVMMGRKKCSCGKPATASVEKSRQESDPSAPPVEDNAPVAEEASTATVPAQEPSETAATNAST